MKVTVENNDDGNIRSVTVTPVGTRAFLLVINTKEKRPSVEHCTEYGPVTAYEFFIGNAVVRVEAESGEEELFSGNIAKVGFRYGPRFLVGAPDDVEPTVLWESEMALP